MGPFVRIGAVHVEAPDHFLRERLLAERRIFLEAAPTVGPGGPAPAVHYGIEIGLLGIGALHRKPIAADVKDPFFVPIPLERVVHEVEEVFPDDEVVLQHDDLTEPVHGLRDAGNDGCGESLVLLRFHERDALAPFPGADDVARFADLLQFFGCRAFFGPVGVDEELGFTR